MQTSTSQFFQGKELVYPGDVVIAQMHMAGRDYFAGRLEVGMCFEVREGARVTALGEILEIRNGTLCRLSPTESEL